MDKNNLYIPTDIFITEPAEVYHAKAGQYLSSHQLIDFMKCPLLHHKKRMGIIQDQETTSFLVGRAAHVRILEGRAEYESQFAMGGPINPTSKRKNPTAVASGAYPTTAWPWLGMTMRRPLIVWCHATIKTSGRPATRKFGSWMSHSPHLLPGRFFAVGHGFQRPTRNNSRHDLCKLSHTHHKAVPHL